MVAIHVARGPNVLLAGDLLDLFRDRKLLVLLLAPIWAFKGAFPGPFAVISSSRAQWQVADAPSRSLVA